MSVDWPGNVSIDFRVEEKGPITLSDFPPPLPLPLSPPNKIILYSISGGLISWRSFVNVKSNRKRGIYTNLKTLNIGGMCEQNPSPCRAHAGIKFSMYMLIILTTVVMMRNRKFYRIQSAAYSLEVTGFSQNSIERQERAPWYKLTCCCLLSFCLGYLPHVYLYFTLLLLEQPPE